MKEIPEGVKCFTVGRVKEIEDRILVQLYI